MTPLLALLAIAPAHPGIQWFTRLDQGLAEARRTGMPVFLMSAAPQCAEVPGNW